LVGLPSILIVDDDPAVQMTLRLLLEREGHRVRVAGDGHEGLACVELENFDLVLLDIFMPGMDGLETMRLVRARRPLLPIIVISGRPLPSGTEPDFVVMATKLGAAHGLYKPFRPDSLIAAVTGCLGAANRPSSIGAASPR
jgi:CheY-like chemotaxis protein